jgi:serine/threonine-protein kinase RsbW
MPGDYSGTISLHLPSRLGFERVAMEAAGSAARLVGFRRSRIDDVRTAVSEACINAIEHAHGLNADVSVVVGFTVGDRSLQVDIADKGEGVPSDLVAPDIGKKFRHEQDARGWGVFLMRALMDEVSFNVKSDHGSVTRMVIHLPPPDKTETTPPHE